MRLFEGAWGSGEASNGVLSQAEIGHHEFGPEAPGSVVWQGHPRNSHTTSFIRRCWYPERGCDESSTCSDLRQLWEGAREDVTKLPPPAQCGRPQYIVTGASRTSRNGVMDENRLETLHFPGEKWHKCCIMPGPGGKKPRFVCEHIKTVEQMKLHKEMKGWCGPHMCINPRDRCLIVDEEKIDGFKAKHKGDCPMSCKHQCNKLKQKFECIYIGNEPPYGTEGSETPQKMFNEKENYDVFALATTEEAPPPTPSTTETTESCAPLAVALLPVPAVARESTLRHQRWSKFLS